MFESGSTSAIADHLDSMGDFSAPVVRSLSSPLEVVKLLASSLDDASIIFDLPIKKSDQLEIALQHTGIEDCKLFGLACELAEHVLPIYEEWNAFDTRSHELLQCMREWIVGSTSDESLRDCRKSLGSRAASYKLARMPNAPRAVVSAAMSATNPWAWAKHCVAHRNASETARLAQKAAGTDELDWQLKQTAIAIQGDVNDNSGS